MAFEIISIGSGIAGASLAYRLAQRRQLVLIDRDNFDGTQSTGRSAAADGTLCGTPTTSALDNVVDRVSSARFQSRPAQDRCGANV